MVATPSRTFFYACTRQRLLIPRCLGSSLLQRTEFAESYRVNFFSTLYSAQASILVITCHHLSITGRKGFGGPGDATA